MELQEGVSSALYCRYCSKKIIVAIKCDLLKHCLRKACVGPFNQVTGVSFLSNIF